MSGSTEKRSLSLPRCLGDHGVKLAKLDFHSPRGFWRRITGIPVAKLDLVGEFLAPFLQQCECAWHVPSILQATIYGKVIIRRAPRSIGIATIRTRQHHQPAGPG